MEIALVNEARTLPEPGISGICPACRQPTIAKCGSQVIWHWAHKGRKHCDPWWENESEWHRKWKSYFPERMHEIVLFDESSGEKHIADLKTDSGMVIEIQHSTMPIEELKLREAFYQRMIWIVDGRPFAKQFEVMPELLPHPKAPLLDDVVFHKNHGLFWRRSEKNHDLSLVLIHKPEEIAEQVLKYYRGHHFFEWKRPRNVWLETNTPVFIDFGGAELYRICQYTSPSMPCVQRVSKQALIEKNGGIYE